MDLRDNEMQRGLSQALYKYLPDSWIDFYRKSDRAAFTAYVKNWNSTTLQDVNEDRILMAVDQALKDFQERGKINGFILPVNKDNYDILTPKAGVNSDIITEISPLTFFCSKCHRLHSYKTSAIFQQLNPRRQCTECKSHIKQLTFVYACKCGWAQPVTPIGCRNKAHGFEFLKYKPRFQFSCGICNSTIEIRTRCKACGTFLGPKNALDMGNHIPFDSTAKTK